MRLEEKSTVLRTKERSSEGKAVWHGGHMPQIICLPDCQPDLILFNHNAHTQHDITRGTLVLTHSGSAYEQKKEFLGLTYAAFADTFQTKD